MLPAIRIGRRKSGNGYPVLSVGSAISTSNATNVIGGYAKHHGDHGVGPRPAIGVVVRKPQNVCLKRLRLGFPCRNGGRDRRSTS